MFTQIAATDALFSSLGFFPAINDEGAIVFWAELGNQNSGIFMADDGEVMPVVDAETSPLSLLSDVLINNQNTVALSANIDTIGSGIFSISNGITTTIAASQIPRGAFGEPALNNQGTIAFPVYQYSSEALSSAILVHRQGLNTTVVDSESSFSFFEEIDMNDAGDIAFSAVLDDGSRGIFLERNEEIIPIVDTGESFSFVANPAVNNSGTVVFKGVSKNSAIEGIYAVSDSTTETLVDNQAAFAAFDTPSINDTGLLAFKGFLDDGGFGIFTGSDPIADKVIAVDDALGDSTVTNLFLSQEGLNNNNQIVFYAELADGTYGIFQADLKFLKTEASSL